MLFFHAVVQIQLNQSVVWSYDRLVQYETWPAHLAAVITSPPGGVQSIVMSYVCLSALA